MIYALWWCCAATAYGEGVYFAVNSSYSADNTYSAPNAADVKQMYYARVLVGESTAGSQGLRVLPVKPGSTDKFDSATETRRLRRCLSFSQIRRHITRHRSNSSNFFIRGIEKFTRINCFNHPLHSSSKVLYSYSTVRTYSNISSFNGDCQHCWETVQAWASLAERMVGGWGLLPIIILIQNKTKKYCMYKYLYSTVQFFPTSICTHRIDNAYVNYKLTYSYITG